jgi:hypothetical protein
VGFREKAGELMTGRTSISLGIISWLGFEVWDSRLGDREEKTLRGGVEGVEYRG